jgi:hypothetical protein
MVRRIIHWRFSMNTAASKETLISIREASRRVGLNYAMLRRLISLGRIDSVQIAGITRVRESQIRKQIVERRRA